MKLKDKRIFIVEDNMENRIIYHMILIREGAVFEFERWGNTAVHKLLNFKPVDLIILDLMLSARTTGFTVFDEIRRLPEFNAIPIVAVSSADASEAIPRTRKQGFSGYIAKPINYAIFPNQLCQILAGESIWIDS